MKSLMIFVFIVVLGGCKNKVTETEEKTLYTEFQLIDSLGVPTTSFHVGDNVYFYCAIINRTGETQPWWKSSTAPIVFFEVFIGDSFIGSSVDGMGFADMIVSGKLLNSDILALKDSWLANLKHGVLPVGEYTVWAKPQLRFDNFGALPDEKIDFKILP